MTRLDHIVIVADSLPQGLDYCETLLGIRPPKGGEHDRMGTHNHLLNLGNDTFLEVIAINPAGTQPVRPRWFGMDSSAQRMRLASGPFLATFVVRTKAINTVARKLPAIGGVQDMERGMLHWKITIPENGLLVENGTVPTVIEWPEGVEPTSLMPDLGYRIDRLEAYHPNPQTLKRMWNELGLDDARVSIHACNISEAPHLVAYINTPGGLKAISGRI